MHTSAHTTIAHTGTLRTHAQARTTVLDSEGHNVPVLCLDITLDNALHTRMYAEQCFPAGHHDQCRAAAHRLKTGTRVTIEVPLICISLQAKYASHIHTHPDETPVAATPVDTAADSPAATADLF